MKFKEHLNEDTIDNIAKMVDRNDHNLAMVLGASYLKLKKYQDIFKAIDKIANIERSMPSELSKYRYSKYKEMMDIAKKKLSPKEYQRFYAFLV